MNKHLTRAKELRATVTPHYNCGQSVILPFAEALGYTEETVMRFAANFGGGMGCGSVCGAVTGALLALGGLNVPEERREELLQHFAAAHGSLNCADLVCGLEKGTPERKCLCDALVTECLNFVCEMTGKE